MEEMGEMEVEDCQDPLAHKETKVTKEIKVIVETLVYLDLKGGGGGSVHTLGEDLLSH